MAMTRNSAIVIILPENLSLHITLQGIDDTNSELKLNHSRNISRIAMKFTRIIISITTYEIYLVQISLYTCQIILL